MIVGAGDLEVDVRKDNEDEKDARTSSSFIDITYTCNQPVHAPYHPPEKQFPTAFLCPSPRPGVALG